MEEKLQLSKRLQAVVDLVTKGERVADIGCDHAYISIYMIEQNIASKVIAMDVNKGPLERAKENIQKSHFERQIETRLSDGMKELKPGEVNTLLIAGMGGSLMQRILSGNPKVLEQVNELILQPQSEVRETRLFVERLGFEIVVENMLVEDGKYYTMLKAVRREHPVKMDKEVFYRYGKYLLEHKNMILKEFLEKEQGKLQMITQKLKENPSKLNQERLKKVEEDDTYCKEGLAYYEL